MISNETLLHKDPKTGIPQVIGLGWLDDSMTPNGPTEEDKNVSASFDRLVFVDNIFESRSIQLIRDPTSHCMYAHPKPQNNGCPWNA